MADRRTIERTTGGRAGERLVALSGAAAVVVLVAGSSVGDTGGKGIDPTMGPERILRDLTALDVPMRLSAALLGVAAVLLLVFLGPLWRRLADVSSPAAVVGVAGGVLAAVLVADSARETIALATAVEVGDAVTAQVLVTTGWDTARILAVPFLAMVAAAVVVASAGAFPTWFRWFSLLVLLPLVIALGPVGPAGLLGLTGAVWVLVTSILFAVESRVPSGSGG